MDGAFVGPADDIAVKATAVWKACRRVGEIWL